MDAINVFLKLSKPIETIDNIDYKIFNHLSKTENKFDGTNVDIVLSKINNLVKNENDDDLKLVFIFTDGKFTDEIKALLWIAPLILNLVSKSLV